MSAERLDLASFCTSVVPSPRIVQLLPGGKESGPSIIPGTKFKLQYNNVMGNQMSMWQTRMPDLYRKRYRQE